MRRRYALSALALTLALGACGTAVSTETTPAITDAEATDSTGAVGEAEQETGSDAGGAAASADDESNSVEELFPDVVDAVATADGDGTWTFAVTLSSPYDSPDRYADSWRVRSEDGTTYGERFLTHDHANEQPFTRSQSGIEIPGDVDVVVVEGHDQVSGWGGETLTVTLDRS